MKQKGSVFVCQQCGYESVGWLGKCPNCNSWGSMVETSFSQTEDSKGLKKKGMSSPLTSLNKIPVKDTKRISTKIDELDRVLGGGIVAGQVILIAGEPGIGKSTLLMGVADKLGSVLYICGEESKGQIKLRAHRMKIKSDILLLEETNLENIISSIEAANIKLNGIVVDSIQTIQTGNLTGLAGSVGQVRESAFRLLKVAKRLNIPLFLVGHVTKEGSIAGPAVLTHIVDTVLWFEGDKKTSLRMLRAVKNRFGPTDEVGLFEMTQEGLVSMVNADKIFLTEGKKEIPGSVAASIIQGTRPILVEIQSLIVPSKLPFPKRIAQGISPARLELLLAVLIRRCSLSLYEYDCFINVAGGIKVVEPASDLAVCLSIASSYFDRPVPLKTVAVGEVGLLGEIRKVPLQEKRIKEARRQGYNLSISSDNFKYLNLAVGRLFKK